MTHRRLLERYNTAKGGKFLMEKINWVHVGVVTGLGFLALGLLGWVAQNQQVNPKFRVIAQTLEGLIVQDMETGAIHLVAAAV
jgi:hypothetical protein